MVGGKEDQDPLTVGFDPLKNKRVAFSGWHLKFHTSSNSAPTNISELHLHHLLPPTPCLQKPITRRKNILKKPFKLYLKAISPMSPPSRERKRLIKEFSIIVEIRPLSKSPAKHSTNDYFKHKKHLLFNILHDAIKWIYRWFKNTLK